MYCCKQTDGIQQALRDEVRLFLDARCINAPESENDSDRLAYPVEVFNSLIILG
jgi:hypothetical protein